MKENPLAIVSARIERLPRAVWMASQQPGDSIVHIKVEGLEEEELFRFYSDEIDFVESEFVGKTRDEAFALRLEKDKKWLCAPDRAVVR